MLRCKQNGGSFGELKLEQRNTPIYFWKLASYILDFNSTGMFKELAGRPGGKGCSIVNECLFQEHLKWSTES